VEPLAGRRIEPISGLPIALQKAKVGAAEAVAFRLPDDVEPKEAFLELLVADVDSTKEVQISVNKQGPVYLPQKVVARRTGHAAQVALNPKHLKPGGNVVSFKFADASEGERDGFGIDVAVLVVLHEPTAQPTYVTDGLVIHYDVTAGSMPDDKGAVMDISGNNLHGRMRSIGRGLDSVARRNDEYQIINRSGGSPDRVSEVRLSRKAWVDVPLNDQLLAIDGDGTFEFVVRVMPSGAMPQLMDFGSIRSDQRQLSHYIGFDFRGSNNGQYLFSDTRKVSEGPVHSVMVNKGGWPQPAPPGVQQIAYVVKDGKGRFLTNGLEHSIQSVRAGIERASMFKWVSDAAGGKPADVRLSLFAGVDAAGAGGGFMGGFIAVRLYDRPLSPGELRQNYQATIGVEPPSQRSMDVLARAINWSRP
ncbi:MAG: hypothetical protein QF735_12550, partial [Phycisphaeraceae bacterium]|nr:hypothetical protein [Phycisphaeraceae bacterium]